MFRKIINIFEKYFRKGKEAPKFDDIPYDEHGRYDERIG
jgi:hypothetical protein